MSSEQVISGVVAEMKAKAAMLTGNIGDPRLAAALLCAAFQAWADRLSTPAAGNLVTVPASELRAMRERHQALLDGIEGLEKEIEFGGSIDWPHLISEKLKALREKANGSQGAVPSTRPWPGKCIK